MATFLASQTYFLAFKSSSLPVFCCFLRHEYIPFFAPIGYFGTSSLKFLHRLALFCFFSYTFYYSYLQISPLWKFLKFEKKFIADCVLHLYRFFFKNRIFWPFVSSPFRYNFFSRISRKFEKPAPQVWIFSNLCECVWTRDL